MLLEVAARLRRDGLRTFGQVARVGVQALLRQFGDEAGRVLAAVANEEYARPLAVTPAPARQVLRVRFDEPLPAERVLEAVLPLMATRLAAQLRAQRRRAGSLVLGVWWDRAPARNDAPGRRCAGL